MSSIKNILKKLFIFSLFFNQVSLIVYKILQYLIWLDKKKSKNITN
jgi:hypothetical protein